MEARKLVSLESFPAPTDITPQHGDEPEDMEPIEEAAIQPEKHPGRKSEPDAVERAPNGIKNASADSSISNPIAETTSDNAVCMLSEKKSPQRPPPPSILPLAPPKDGIISAEIVDVCPTNTDLPDDGTKTPYLPSYIKNNLKRQLQVNSLNGDSPSLERPAELNNYPAMLGKQPSNNTLSFSASPSCSIEELEHETHTNNTEPSDDEREAELDALASELASDIVDSLLISLPRQMQPPFQELRSPSPIATLLGNLPMANENKEEENAVSTRKVPFIKETHEDGPMEQHHHIEHSATNLDQEPASDREMSLQPISVGPMARDHSIPGVQRATMHAEPQARKAETPLAPSTQVKKLV
jgi:hypothetical protein